MKELKSVTSLPSEKHARIIKAFEICGERAYLIYLFPTLIKFMNVKDSDVKTFVSKLLNQISESFGVE